MDSMFLLIPVTVVILAIAVWGFIWAVNSDQFDDMDSPASRILFDDDEQATIEQIKQQNLAKKQKKEASSVNKNSVNENSVNENNEGQNHD